MNVRLRPLGGTGLLVSEIGLGALEIGRDWAPDVNADCSHPTQAEAERVLNGILDLGINFIDTAPAYWSSEEFIGSAISHRRSEFVLATKVGEHCDRKGSVYDYSYAGTLRFVNESLRRMRTDYIDLLQIHSASIEVLEKGETLEAMQEAKRAGKVRHLGMTGGVAECVRALQIGGYETVQFPYNLLNLAAEEQLLPLARDKNAGVIIMRALAGGKLSRKHANLPEGELRNSISGFQQFAPTGTDDPLVHLSIQYLLARPEISSLIIGSRKLETIERNVDAANLPVAPEVLAATSQYASTFKVGTW